MKVNHLLDADSAAKSFLHFLSSSDIFRERAHLKNEGNPERWCNAMTDKHGRICRHIKHMERNDPKDTWPAEMVENLIGYIVYAQLILNYYHIPRDLINDALVSEFLKAVEQHQEEGVDCDS